MQNQTTLTTNGMTPKNFLFLFFSVLMIFVGLYLNNHYMQTMYPEGIQNSSSLCDISSFFNCDTTTKSMFGNIMGVPTSLFGVILGLLGLITSIGGNKKLEDTTRFVFLINAVICLALFIYSLAALGSLCPMCTLYYVLSFASLFLLIKNTSAPLINIDVKVSLIVLAFIILPSFVAKSYLQGKEEKKNVLTKSYIEQFHQLKTYGDPAIESPFKLNKATEKFSDAPIRISIFSDFQCPYCKSVAEQMLPIIEEFKDKINVQYMFYPLDSSCNQKMEGSMHPYACQAAFLAACDEAKFEKIHDHIFANQEKINVENLKKWEADFGLSGCFENSKNFDVVQQTMSSGLQYELRSTPTIIVNGKKLEGLIPSVHFKGILNSLLK